MSGGLTSVLRRPPADREHHRVLDGAPGVNDAWPPHHVVTGHEQLNLGVRQSMHEPARINNMIEVVISLPDGGMPPPGSDRAPSP